MVTNNQIYPIQLDDIRVDRFNVRRHDRESNVDQLAESIKNHGQMQPVVLIGTHGKPPYQLIVGQRRYLAHQKLKKKTINAVFIEKKLSEVDALLYSLAENLQRTELNFTDKSDTITRIYILLGKDLNKVAKELGISKNTVVEYIKINDFLDDKTKKIVKDNRISKSELNRAIRISKGDTTILRSNLEKFNQLSPFEQKRAVEFSAEKPKATFSDAMAVGKKPKISTTVVINLSEQITKALDQASSKMSMDKDEIALKALEDWLEVNGFLS